MTLGNNMSMGQKCKLSFFSHQVILYIIFLGFLGCGLPKDTKEDIDIISENTESLDESIKKIVEVVEGGVPIIIEGVKFENIEGGPSLNGDSEKADELSDFGIDTPEDLFSDESDSIESTLQNFKAKLIEELEKMGPDDENRDSIERIIEQITQSLGENDMGQ